MDTHIHSHTSLSVSHTRVHSYAHMCVCICVYVYMYIYIYTCIFTHVPIHVQIICHIHVHIEHIRTHMRGDMRLPSTREGCQLTFHAFGITHVPRLDAFAMRDETSMDLLPGTIMLSNPWPQRQHVARLPSQDLSPFKTRGLLTKCQNMGV